MTATMEFAKLLYWNTEGRMMARCDEFQIKSVVAQMLVQASAEIPLLVIVEPDRLNSTFVNEAGDVVFTHGPHVPLVISDPKRIYVFGKEKDSLIVADRVFSQPVGHMAPMSSLSETKLSELVYVEDPDANGCFFRAQICMQLYLVSSTTTVGAKLSFKDKSGQWTDLNTTSLTRIDNNFPAIPPASAAIGEAQPSSLSWDDILQLLDQDQDGSEAGVFDEPMELDDFDRIFFSL